jgi:hypothetical protein
MVRFAPLYDSSQEQLPLAPPSASAAPPPASDEDALHATTVPTPMSDRIENTPRAVLASEESETRRRMIGCTLALPDLKL